MSDTYGSLKASLYKSFSEVVKDIPIIFAYQNGIQPKTTFMTIDIVDWAAKGRGYKPTLIVDERQTTSVIYEVRVRTEFHNPAEEDIAPNLALQLDSDYEAWLLNEVLHDNNLSYMRRGSVKRVPKNRDTKWYMSYQQDVYFTFQHNKDIPTPAIHYVKIATERGDIWIPEAPPQ